VESKSPLVDPSWEFPALRPRFSRVLSHICEEGDTLEIDVASLSTLTHVTTYIRGEVIALGDFNMEQHRGVQEHHTRGLNFLSCHFMRYHASFSEILKHQNIYILLFYDIF
jgi:hypothetical protein